MSLRLFCLGDRVINPSHVVDAFWDMTGASGPTLVLVTTAADSDGRGASDWAASPYMVRLKDPAEARLVWAYLTDAAVHLHNGGHNGPQSPDRGALPSQGRAPSLPEFRD